MSQFEKNVEDTEQVYHIDDRKSWPHYNLLQEWILHIAENVFPAYDQTGWGGNNYWWNNVKLQILIK